MLFFFGGGGYVLHKKKCLCLGTKCKFYFQLHVYMNWNLFLREWITPALAPLLRSFVVVALPLNNSREKTLLSLIKCEYCQMQGCEDNDSKIHYLIKNNTFTFSLVYSSKYCFNQLIIKITSLVFEKYVQFFTVLVLQVRVVN